MSEVKKYLFSRIITYFLEILFALSLCFIIARIGPIDPILEIIGRVTAMSEYIDPASAESLRETLLEFYGLKGSLFDQYKIFILRALVGDFGPSYSVFPTPVMEIMKRALPWTLMLLSWATLIGWILGNLIGCIAGFFSGRKWSRMLSSFALSIYPIPYYILSLILIFLFAYIFPIFPSGGGGVKYISLENLPRYIRHAFLPGLSLVLGNYGWWFISMRNIVTNTKVEDYVQFAEYEGLPTRTVLLKYILRNSLLPQTTGLAISLGGIFSGALATEVIFEYPGIGYILYVAVTRGDFNLMLGILIFSIFGVATAALLIDLIYPLIDPRIRYR